MIVGNEISITKNSDKNFANSDNDKNDISEDVLGIKIPKIVVPVSSGRSMSVIIEAAVMNMRLRDVGIDSSKEFVERILKNIDHNKQEQ